MTTLTGVGLLYQQTISMRLLPAFPQLGGRQRFMLAADDKEREAGLSHDDSLCESRNR